MEKPVQNIAIFASGTGTNAQTILEFFQYKSDVNVVLVVSNRAGVGVLEIAKSFGVDDVVIQRKDFYDTENILSTLDKYEVDWIVLAGFLWLIPGYLLEAFPNRIINIHPALLPKFGGRGMYGMNVHQAVKAAGETESGITIHFVNGKYDEGAIIFQASCPISPEEEAEDIARKVQVLEHTHYPRVIDRLIH